MSITDYSDKQDLEKDSNGFRTPAIRIWHIVISGFLQNEGSADNGMIRLFGNLHHNHGGTDALVELRSWNDNWNNLAEHIWRVRPRRGPMVNVYAYSWGAGWGAMQLARQLDRRGLIVDNMVLSDPVHRPRCILFRPFALSRWARIRIPQNVRKIAWWCRQQKNRPAGHDLIATSGNTSIAKPLLVHREHQYMDNLDLFHEACERVAKSCVPY